ncbi:AfsR/SARP family transcriptional regulator [Lentzea sp. NPDC051838]|uniref:AfsR/SARP family transcriptional regulator n=1 Tax=Lentzea sp. NPDC051838 TaxID=3154849 RepID=UPI00343C34F0
MGDPQPIFRVLGPLRVEHRGRVHTPTASKQRQVLLLLLLRANSTVSLPQFVEELWEGYPPASAIPALHTYVMQLRRALDSLHLADGPASSRLVTRTGGYELVVRPGELDLDVFDEKIQAALAQTDSSTRARGLHEALELWTAPALADVVTGPVMRSAITVLQQKRLDALGHRIDADLEVGWHHELIGELSSLVLHNSTSERFTAQLMLALYRSGRQVDALNAFHRLRRAEGRLSRELHDLYTAILAGDPALDPPIQARTRLSLDAALIA